MYNHKGITISKTWKYFQKNYVRLQANDDNEVDENVDDYQDGMDINANDQNVKSPAGNSKNTSSSYSSGPEVSSRSTQPKIDAVYDALDDEHKELFINSCFGKLYNVRTMQISPKLIHNMLIKTVRLENIDELWFCLRNEQAARFSFFKFTLVTSFKPGDEAEYKNRIVQNKRLFEKYFRDRDKITPSCLCEVFENKEDDMDDKYKLGLACIYESVLRAKEMNRKIDGHILDLATWIYSTNIHGAKDL
ncbi:protein of unknown function-containing protein [Forsythia ovata]|uniref:DUF1985 domain-containing protein n=1 Tax=Forsythia ovata TaxID=205694 RepID=A0ABD1XC90_9LAMI